MEVSPGRLSDWHRGVDKVLRATRPLSSDGVTRSDCGPSAFAGTSGISAPLWKDAAGGGTAPGLRLLNRWLWLFGAVAVGLGVFSKRWPAPLSEPADPTDWTYSPRPEWWVLWLNQLVTIFTGPLSVVGMLVIPGGLIALLLALPWLDRNPERDPACRKMAMLGWFDSRDPGYVVTHRIL